MCAVWGGGKLGLAFYLVETAHLHIMPDRAESEDFGLLKRGGSGQSRWLFQWLFSLRSSYI